MVISIDYDETITADVELWTEVIQVFKKYLHEVIITSARDESYGNRREIETAFPNTKVLLTTNEQKESYALKNGYAVDIWIDDIPASIPSAEKAESWLYVIGEERIKELYK